MTRTLNYLFFLSLMSGAFILLSLMVILLITSIGQPIEKGTLIGMGVFSLVSLIAIRVSWRYLARYSKEEVEHNEREANKKQKLAQIKKERFEKLSSLAKERELRANQEADALSIDKALKSIRIFFLFFAVFLGAMLYLMAYAIPDEAYWFKVGFGVFYLLMLVFMVLMYRWRAKVYRQQ